ncbi:MAG: ABC transporter ATP-binding protein [Planctomycetota bacterium]|nr:ABC transporter ATP-binding protein [Planctomycetota bacterium]MDP6762062.1 ABC transporter ATP-binding protein [Planctomycetota bacterium]MDP6989161.1 ABC transporter ATP-binding protein [Planctomycetota bacterium]
MDRPLAQFRGVGKRFGDRTALAALDLTVRRGEVLGLLGPNGAGKTTTLRLACGLITPTEGAVEVAGHDTQREPLEVRRHLGFVPDGAPLYANLSAREHLALVGRLHELGDERTRDGSDELLASLGLAERADEPVGRFSRGMRQRVALACALLPRPALLVLDEPLTGLDPPAAAMLKALLRGWAERGGAVLYTSHLLDVVERVCDRMAILDQGRLVGVGSLAELRERADGDESLEEVFTRVARSADPRAEAGSLLTHTAPRAPGG